MKKRQLRTATLRVEFVDGDLTSESKKAIRRFGRRLARGTGFWNRALDKFEYQLREGYQAVRREQQKKAQPRGVKAAETRRKKRKKEKKRSHRRRRGINYYFGAHVFAPHLERFFRRFPDRKKPVDVLYNDRIRRYGGWCWPHRGRIEIRPTGNGAELETMAHELVHLHWPQMRHGKEFRRLTRGYLEVLQGEK